jgi:carbamoyl-phosphate synthase small subunit
LSHSKPAILVLADGTKFRGKSIGAEGSAVGEVVFNTSMTGYQEILTDPSYTNQIVCLTYSHIGNVGINVEDMESQQVYAKSLIIRDLSLIDSNFRSEQDLTSFLKENNIVAISDIDTRQLTKHIRVHGAQAGTISTDDNEAKALSGAQAFPGLSGMDLAKVVSTKKTYTFDEGEWHLGTGFEKEKTSEFNVVAFDFGVKKNILRMLVSRGCKVTVVPAETKAEDVMKLNPDGIFLSNGPGDPEPCLYAIESIRKFVQEKIPLFGICLGHQLLALALGAKTLKMKFGHHGANHPVQDLNSKKVFITSQNHGFAVDEDVPDSIEITHRSLFDNTIQGIRLKNAPAFSFQGHPEASPGPQEMSYLFDGFLDSMRGKKES